MDVIIHNILYEILKKKRILSFKTYLDAEKRTLKKQYDVIVDFYHSGIYTNTNYSYFSMDGVSKYNGLYINQETNKLDCYIINNNFFNHSFSCNISKIQVHGKTPQSIKYGKIHEYFKPFFIKNYSNCTGKEFNENIPDEVFQNKLIESISEDIKVGFTYPYELKVSEFPEMVYTTLHHSMSGTLGNSCMRVASSHGCRHHSKAYNGICKILYAQDEKNLLLGRALIWENCIVDTNLSNYINTKENNTPCTFLDRPYGNEAFQLAALRYAKEQGWKYRTFESSQIFNSDDTTSPLLYKHCPELPNYLTKNGTPYFDTFRYFNPKYRLITDRSTEKGPIPIKLVGIGSSRGNVMEAKYFYNYICKCCKKGYNEEDNELGHPYQICNTCAVEKLKTCACCEIKSTNLKYDSTLKIYYCSDKCLNSLSYIKCDDCGKNIEIKKAEGVIIDDNPCIICSSCKKDYNRCKVCNNFTINNTSICKKCSDLLNICKSCDNYFFSLKGVDICPNCTNEYAKNYETYQFYLDIENLE